MFFAGEIIPFEELAHRHAKCRMLLAQHCPEAGGLLVVSRIAIYYLTGTLANGIFWLPLEGKPVLLVRKGLERVALECPHENLLATTTLRSYGELAKKIAAYGNPLPSVIAAEKTALPWHLAEMLMSRMPEQRFITGDTVLARARAVKTPWELTKMRQAGSMHHTAVHTLLPSRLQPGMSERDISLLVWELFFSLGAAGPARMSNFGEEVFLGHVSAGDIGNYPSHYNGPLGLMGTHPATPFMGNAKAIWHKNAPLAIDTCFTFEGYNTDKTQLYFSGSQEAMPVAAAKAHQLCLDIEQTVAEQLCVGAIPEKLYALAISMADKAGFTNEFMGAGGNQVPFLGHGIGLAVDEWPVLALRFSEPLQAGMTIALEPKIGIPGFGMVGSENTYEVTEKGGVCISGNMDSCVYIR